MIHEKETQRKRKQNGKVFDVCCCNEEKCWIKTVSIYIEEEHHWWKEAQIASIGRLKIVELVGCRMSRVSSYFSRSLETQYHQILHHSWDTLKYDTIYLKLFKYIAHKYLFGHSFVAIFLYNYIWTFICIEFVIQIYSDIHSCKFFDTNIYAYIFRSKFSRISHSGVDPSMIQNIFDF